MLDIQSVSVDVGHTRIVSDVNAALVPGHSMAILGANGAGKSTLMAALSGERQTVEGNILLDKQNIRDYSLRQLARARAVMQQQQAFSFDFSVMDYLLLARSCHDETRQQALHYLTEVVNELNLFDFLERRVTQLSGGERQRIEFARVWLQVLDRQGVQGKLLLLDEPTSALDIRQQQLFFNYLTRFCQRGGMVLCVLHDINQAARHVDSILMLHSGQQAVCGPVAQAFSTESIQRCFDVEGQVTWLSGHHFPQFYTNHSNQEIA